MDTLNIFYIIRNAISCLGFFVGMGGGVFLFIRKQQMAGLLVIAGFFLFSLDTIADFFILRLLYNRLLYYGEHREEINQILDYLYLCISAPSFFFGSIALMVASLKIRSHSESSINIQDSSRDAEFRKKEATPREIVNRTIPQEQTHTVVVAAEVNKVAVENAYILRSDSKDIAGNGDIDSIKIYENKQPQPADEERIPITTSHGENLIAARKLRRDFAASFLKNLRGFVKISVRIIKYVRGQINKNFYNAELNKENEASGPIAQIKKLGGFGPSFVGISVCIFFVILVFWASYYGPFAGPPNKLIMEDTTSQSNPKIISKVRCPNLPSEDRALGITEEWVVGVENDAAWYTQVYAKRNGEWEKLWFIRECR